MSRNSESQMVKPIISDKDPGYRQCAFTVMDNIADNNISFNKDGICNYYFEYKKEEAAHVFKGEEGSRRLHALTKEIKQRGRTRPYDCLIGLSGGVDSSYVAFLTKQLGLRPLAVHLDNGWNSELAVMNIESIVNKLEIDLVTLVINWEEFRDIQLSYLKASVVDIEVVSDHAIFSTMYRLAREKGIRYIISGTNIVTEQIMPPTWLYKKMDFTNLRDIHRRYGKVKLKTYPFMDFKRYVYHTGIHKLSPVSILNFVPYNKNEIKQLIANELGWRDYGGKHYESLFTKFYQAYILPQKFKIDKRKAHLSTLICSGQLTKEEAFDSLKEPLYKEEELSRDKEYVLKKLRLTDAEFQSIMDAPPRPHEEFNSDMIWRSRYMSLLRATQNIRKYLSFY